MTNLEQLPTEELQARVDGFFGRLVKSLCDAGGDHQSVTVARDAWLELAKRLEEASKALDELAEASTSHVTQNGYTVYLLLDIADPRKCPVLHAQIAKRKQK